MRTLAIIPAFNEAESLPAVLAGLRRALPDVDVLVIDDGSSDATSVVARENGALVAPLPFNLGIGAALRTGFRFADEQSYDRAFQFDADGQHDAGEVVKLLDALDDGADLVIGTRFAAADGEYVVGFARGGAMALLRMILRLLLGRRFTDTSSGFRGFGRTAIRYFSNTYPKEYMDSVEALVAASYEGMRIVEVSVTMHERSGGEPSNRNFKLLYHYVRVLSHLAITVSSKARRSVVPGS